MPWIFGYGGAHETDNSRKFAQVDEPLLVKLRDIRLKHLRDFGDFWLALGLWRLLGLNALLIRLVPDGREDVPWVVVATLPLHDSAITARKRRPCTIASWSGWKASSRSFRPARRAGG